MDSIEDAFRATEARLDAWLRSARPALDAAGIRVRDESARTYHYKNDALSWRHALSREAVMGLETACVTVVLATGEPDAADAVAEVRVTSRAELFRTGQPSRISLWDETWHTLATLERAGPQAVVLAAIEQGFAKLAAAAER
jgi:hypothetical protein